MGLPENGSSPDHPSHDLSGEIFGELQFEELDLLSDRQAEQHIGGGFGCAVMNSTYNQCLRLVLPRLRGCGINSTWKFLLPG